MVSGIAYKLYIVMSAAMSLWFVCHDLFAWSYLVLFTYWLIKVLEQKRKFSCLLVSPIYFLVLSAQVHNLKIFFLVQQHNSSEEIMTDEPQ